MSLKTQNAVTFIAGGATFGSLFLLTYLLDTVESQKAFVIKVCVDGYVMMVVHYVLVTPAKLWTCNLLALS